MMRLQRNAPLHMLRRSMTTGAAFSPRPYLENGLEGSNMTKRILIATIGAALCLATTASLSAAGSRSPTTMKPLKAISLDVGSKHVVGYFLNAEGQCKLTLMIADAARDDSSEPSTQVMRLRLMVEPGRSALVDTTEGRMLQFACESQAQAMNASLLDQVAAGRDSK
ncbi:MAG TPA: hypothetical protein VLK25_10015 [Allosphingosinicella sp.]|nr:hypothetical protein [Allosphingosinicella sp.]